MNSIAGKNVVLIGGAGFIGHNLAVALKSYGAKVTIIDSLQVNNLLSFAYSNFENENQALYYRLVNERFEVLRKLQIPIEVLDARDYHGLCKILGEIKPQVIVQLAAVAHANRSNKDPYSTFDHSLRTLENALDNARSSVEHFIYFSSSMVYGNFESDFVTEETPCNPLGIYGALKYAGEKFVIAYNQVFGTPYTIIRPSALYGERCISRRVIQVFIEKALKGESVNIHGDGSDKLDFTYIQDLVQGVCKVIASEKSKNEIFNLTYGQGRSIKEVAELVAMEIPGVKINYLPKDALMPERGRLCVDKAKELIGYAPQFPLDKGVVKYARWYKDIFAAHQKGNQECELESGTTTDMSLLLRKSEITMKGTSNGPVI